MSSGVLIHESTVGKGVTASILFSRERRVLVGVNTPSWTFESSSLSLAEAWCFVHFLPRMQIFEREGLEDLAETVIGSHTDIMRLLRLAICLDMAADELVVAAWNRRVWPPARELKFMITQTAGEQREEFLAMLNLAIRRQEIDDPHVIELVDRFSVSRESARVPDVVAVFENGIQSPCALETTAKVSSGSLLNKLLHYRF